MRDRAGHREGGSLTTDINPGTPNHVLAIVRCHLDF